MAGIVTSSDEDQTYIRVIRLRYARLAEAKRTARAPTERYVYRISLTEINV